MCSCSIKERERARVQYKVAAVFVVYGVDVLREFSPKSEVSERQKIEMVEKFLPISNPE